MPRNLQHPLVQRLKTFLQQRGFANRQEPILVAVSGGPDSVCLVHALWHLREDLGLTLHLTHLNHGLRGAEADADARYVRRLARRLGLPATIERRDVQGSILVRQRGLEDAARQVRYAFLTEVGERMGACAVVLGHTADDQAETVLLHLVRGSGLAGLGGMQETSELPLPSGARVALLRPLLQSTREETESYCKAHRLRPHQDTSNLSPRFLRNRVRRELIPLLRRYNPAVGEALQRLASAASTDLDFIQSEVRRLWPRVARKEPWGIDLRVSKVLALHPALQRHVLRHAIEEVAGDAMDIEAVHLEAMLGLLGKPTGSTLHLPRGLVFAIGYGICALSRGEGPACPYPPLSGVHRLKVPGETLLPGWKVVAQAVPSPWTGEGWGEGIPDPFTAYLDLEGVGMELYVRTRRPGDRFQPSGMAQEKKLQDFFVDEKVPRAWRDRVPLLCNAAGRVLWVVGWRVGDRARGTGRAVAIVTFERRD